MIFNSVEYCLFFALVLLLYFALAPRFRWMLLLVASYVFYMRWNPYYAALIATTTVLSYASAMVLARAGSVGTRRLLMLAGVGSTLGLLFVFKYWNFFNESARVVSASLGLVWQVPNLGVLLPVGISFYTFQTLGYVVDVHRRQIAPETHLGRFALYVAFFPQLVAGPIERARNLLPQFLETHRPDWTQLTMGLQLALWGLFKKVVIADRLAIYVNTVYNSDATFSGATNALATYAFAFQIYCDFSGYSDIAIGCALALGFRLTRNFRLPYFATNFSDFWQRWHITLSTWLRDFVFLPLGGAGRGQNRAYANLLITMTLCGLWHGASWNFVIWGSIHGTLMALSVGTMAWRDRVYEGLGVPTALRQGIRMFITFHVYCLSMIFFRAGSLPEAYAMISSFFEPWGSPLVNSAVFAHGALGLAILLAVQLVQARRGSSRAVVAAWPAPLRWALWYALILSIPLFGVDGGSQFIYFQF